MRDEVMFTLPEKVPESQLPQLAWLIVLAACSVGQGRCCTVCGKEFAAGDTAWIATNISHRNRAPCAGLLLLHCTDCDANDALAAFRNDPAVQDYGFQRKSDERKFIDGDL